MGVWNPADFISRHTGSTQAVQYSLQRKILEKKKPLICVTQTKMKEISPTITTSQNAEPPRSTETAHSVFYEQLEETPTWSRKLRICWVTACFNSGLGSPGGQLPSPALPLLPWANFLTSLTLTVTTPISRGYCADQNELCMWHAESEWNKCSENVCHWSM